MRGFSVSLPSLIETGSCMPVEHQVSLPYVARGIRYNH
jgi:hypothetical protein